MGDNTRYTVAIHILTLLASSGSERLTSEHIAGSVNTNPVVIRRLLGTLRVAKLVRSQGGPGGGWALACSPRAITLRDVYRAVDDGTLFPLHRNPPNPLCPVGKNIQAILTGRFQEAQMAMEKDLERVTIADVVEDVKNQRKE